MLLAEFGFNQRAILLVSLMVAIAGWDWYRKRAEATKYREYGFILLTGIIGGAFGFLNDLLTATISPDYFIYGKGLEPGEGLRLMAGLLGMQTGVSAGVVGGAVTLFLCGKKTNYQRLVRRLWIPIAGAILFAVTFPLLFRTFDPAGYAATLKELVSPVDLSRFQIVWWTHTGLYAGYLIGLIAMIQSLKRQS